MPLWRQSAACRFRWRSSINDFKKQEASCIKAGSFFLSESRNKGRLKAWRRKKKTVGEVFLLNNNPINFSVNQKRDLKSA